MGMKQTLSLAVFCVCAVLSAQAAEPANKLSETRAVLEKWVETRQLVSKTRADWQADKETLQQTVVMLERELKAVDDQFTKLSTNNVQAEKERLEAETLIKTSSEGLAPAQEFAVEFEGKIETVVPRLPEPLKDILKPLLARLLATGTNIHMKVHERVQ